MGDQTLTYYIIFFIMVVGIIIFLNNSRSENVVKRNLNRVKYKKNGEVKDEEVVKVKGNVMMLGEFLKAPISRRKCVYYHLIVKKIIRSGKATHTETLIDEEKGVNVVLKDEDNGYILVETDLIHAHIFKDKEYTIGYSSEMEDSLKDLLEKRGFRNINIGFPYNNSISFEEGALTEGELVKVVGKAKWISVEEAGIDIPVKKILRIRAQDSEPNYMSDDPSTIIGSID